MAKKEEVKVEVKVEAPKVSPLSLTNSEELNTIIAKINEIISKLN